MPAYCVQEAAKLLNKLGKKSVVNSVITLLGLSFRGGVSDTRLSPTYDVIYEFLNLKVREIRIHDPLVVQDPKLSDYPINIVLTHDITKALQNTDLIFIVADHPEYSLLDQKMFNGVPVYDGRGILRKSGLFDLKLKTIGVGNPDTA
jgi:UDP-N-acetyl-D-mannosaminuronate dehydrogenase